MGFLRTKKLDATSGNLLVKILIYSLPLVATGMLQLLYNAADTVIAGRYSADGEAALAAVGSCGALINLIVNLFMGLSVGAGVCVAHDYGAEQYDGVKRTVHTAVPAAAILGLIVGTVGFIAAEPLLVLTGVREDVLAQAAPYMRAYMTGIPASMVYNYCASMLRSTGDTAHPLIFLSISGIANVILNVIMVVGFGLGALGVGIATSVSTWLSAVMILVFMMRGRGYLHFDIREMKIHKDKLLKIIRIGLPAGLQSCMFSLSNVMIQSAVNSFELKTFIAGNTAAASIEGFVYIAMNSFYHAALTFVGQNVGAKRYENIAKITWLCTACVLGIGILVGGAAVLFGHQLLGIYAPGNEVAIEYGMRRLYIVAGTYFLCGLMEVSCGVMRGMGNSTAPMIMSLLGSCVFRIVWILTVFAAFHTPEMLYISYPISWIMTSVAQYIGAAITLHSIKKKHRRLLEAGRQLAEA